MITPSPIESLESRIAPAIIIGTDNFEVGSVLFDTVDFLAFNLSTPQLTGKLIVTGTVTIDSGSLYFNLDQQLPDGSEFTLIENDGVDEIEGEFFGLAEGTVFKVEQTWFRITYVGGDGNDLVIEAFVPDLRISANGKTATYTDVDGDIVTVKTNRGAFTEDNFVLVPNGDQEIRGAQLAALNLDSTFANANITVTAKPGFLGNGFANVGYLNATGTNLGKVTIKGDLARIDAGATTGTAPSVKALTVQSIGQLGTSTLESGSTSLESTFGTKLKSLVVKSDVRGASLTAAAGFGTVKINGSFIESQLLSGTDIGAITIKHDLEGTAANPALISAFGNAVAPKRGVDLAIKSLTVHGNVEWANIFAGYSLDNEPLNADASIGPVKVGGDWIASNMTAGSDGGPNGHIGTGDDARFDNAGMFPGFRDNAAIIAQIASITIAGQVLGTPSTTADSFGFVAEWIRKMSIGGTKVALFPTAYDDFIPLASTGQGVTGLRSDVYLVEVYPSFSF